VPLSPKREPLTSHSPGKEGRKSYIYFYISISISISISLSKVVPDSQRDSVSLSLKQEPLTSHSPARPGGRVHPEPDIYIYNEVHKDILLTYPSDERAENAKQVRGVRKFVHASLRIYIYIYI